MSTRIAAILGLLALAIPGATELAACGDKFLVGLRGGAGFRYLNAAHPTSILVYWQADLDDTEDAGDQVLKAALETAGHTVVIAKDSAAFYREAATGAFEVFMMELATARAEQGRLSGVAPDSAILPVLHFATRREYAAVKKEFGHAVRTPTTLNELLPQIDKARQAAGLEATPWTAADD